MFNNMMKMMELQAAGQLEEGLNARAFWYREWARNNQRAFDPEATCVYTSAYAFPQEILRAFDKVAPFDFECSANMLCAADLGVPPMEAAEERGLSRDVCSVHRAALGAYDLGMFPKPDFFTTVSYYCDGKVKTNEILAIESGKASALLYVPDKINRDSIAYVALQLKQIVARLEEVTGTAFDIDRLRECIRFSNQARSLQLELSELQKNRPAPLRGYTMVGYSINAHIFDGTETLVRMNRAFVEEMKQRIENGSLVPESHRLYWYAWIPTYRCNLFEVLKEHQVSVPHCETMEMHWEEMDEDRPFEGLALKCLQNPFVGESRRRVAFADRAVEEYGVDGALLFATPACRHSKSAYRLLADGFEKKGMPFLMVDVDIDDPRGYLSEQTRTRLEGFIELLSQR